MAGGAGSPSRPAGAPPPNPSADAPPETSGLDDAFDAETVTVGCLVRFGTRDAAQQQGGGGPMTAGRGGPPPSAFLHSSPLRQPTGGTHSPSGSARRPSLEADGVALGQILANRATNVGEYTLNRTASRSNSFNNMDGHDDSAGASPTNGGRGRTLASVLYETSAPALAKEPHPLSRAVNIPARVERGFGDDDGLGVTRSGPVTHDELAAASGGAGPVEAPRPQLWKSALDSDTTRSKLQESQGMISGSPNNPTPQPAMPLMSTEDGGGMLGRRHVIIMVGLPARGKSLIAKRIAKYLSFFHGARCRIFNAGQYRRTYKEAARMPAEFYDPANAEARKLRDDCARMCLDDIARFLLEEDPAPGTPGSNVAKTMSRSFTVASTSLAASGIRSGDTDRAVDSGRVAIFDATNTTRERRQMIKDFFHDLQDTHAGVSSPSNAYGHFGSLVKLVWVESVITDAKQIERNILSGKVANDDYLGDEEHKVLEDFKQRCGHYEKVYEPLGQRTVDGDEGEAEDSWVKTVNGGKKLIINNIHGFLPGRIVQFLANLHLQQHSVYLCRHGQSQYNLQGKIGGDSELTPAGEEFARTLGQYTFEVIQGNATGRPQKCRLWTSCLRRTVQTARYIPRPVIHELDGSTWKQMDGRRMHGLDEVFAGICDGMTYEEISKVYPEEFKLRKENKLSYRYPRGESYLDVVSRLDPLVQEIESYREPLLIVGHQGVLRLIYAYLVGRPREEAPSLSIPLNTVIQLDLLTEGVRETRTELLRVDQRDGQVDPVYSPSFENVSASDPLNPPSH